MSAELRPTSPPEAPSGRRPGDPSWRADALARSRHSRLLDVLRLPEATLDPGRAREVCAEVTRQALLDFAPALLLLPRPARGRAQALGAWALTLFDFARQTGVEGERLAAINRWDFDLENALAEGEAAQPVFARMAEEHRRLPWDAEVLRRISAAARRLVAVPRPADAPAAERRSRELAADLLTALVGAPAPPGAARLGAAALRLRSLQELGEGLRRHRPALPESDLPDPARQGRTEASREELARAVAAECRRLESLLDEAGAAEELPASFRRAGRYLRLASRSLLTRVERAGAGVAERPPRLGAGARLALLLRARWGRAPRSRTVAR